MLLDPLGEKTRVVIMAHGVEARGRTPEQAPLSHGSQFILIEAGFPYTSPVVVIANQIEARGQRAILPDQGAVVPGATVPGVGATPHLFLESLQVCNGVDHGPALTLSIDEPVQELVRLIVFFRRDTQHIVTMLIVIHIDEGLRRLRKVVVGPDTILVGDLGEQLRVLDVCPADIDVEEGEVIVFFLSFNQVPKLRLNSEQRLGQAPSWRQAIYGQIYGGHTGPTDFVYENLVQEIPVGGQIHKKPVFCTIADHLQDKVFAQQWFTSHEGNSPAAYGLEPVHRALSCFKVHARLVIVKLKAVVTVYITSPLDEKIA